MNSSLLLSVLCGLTVLTAVYEVVDGSVITTPTSVPKLLLISMDGFRWDYLQRTNTHNFDQIKQNGVHARRGIKSQFTTFTYPNHYSIVTGLHEESHGIVGNDMYDPDYNEVFQIYTPKSAYNTEQATDSRWFDQGAEPVWVTNDKHSIHHRSGCIMWQGGCEAIVKGLKPYKNIQYDPSISNESRIDTILDWFTAEYPINLGLLYLEEPDEIAHEFGPESPQVTNMIGGLDQVVGHLLKKINDKGLSNDLNLIITSDHGFTSSPIEKVIDLGSFVNASFYKSFIADISHWHSPSANLLPIEGKKQVVYEQLKAGSEENGHFQVYLKDDEQNDIPKEYHYHDNRRIQPILVVADEHYSLSSNHDNGSRHSKGNHGYNNSLPSMHPFFLAMGPAFKTGASVETFNNVDIYPLMCHILKLKPAPNNGSLDNVRALLREESVSGSTFIIYIVILLFITCVGGTFGVAACRVQRYHKRQWTVHFQSLGTVDTSFPNVTQLNNEKSPMLESSEEEDMVQ